MAGSLAAGTAVGMAVDMAVVGRSTRLGVDRGRLGRCSRRVAGVVGVGVGRRREGGRRVLRIWTFSKVWEDGDGDEEFVVARLLMMSWCRCLGVDGTSALRWRGFG